MVRIGKIRALDLFPPMNYDDDDVRLVPVILDFARTYEIHCFTALVQQLENNGLVDWAAAVHRTSEFWTAYFGKWTRENCEGCEPTNGEFLDSLDWSL